jgi:FixJ family two-component response regulator
MSREPDSICILDDDASVRHSIVQLLDSDGLKARSFEDAKVFFAHARSHSVPLAVLDVWMPERSGLQLQARETPAIRAAALEGGAFAFLMKPFDDDTFLSLVRQALRSEA